MQNADESVAKKIERQVGDITYTYTAKKVKNINLRVAKNGKISVSAPKRMPVETVDKFIVEKTEWIQNAQRTLALKKEAEEDVSTVSNEECLQQFESILLQWLPAVQSYVKQTPQLTVKEMKSRWGVCYPTKNKIVLNKRLFAKPYILQEYVVVHELVHFKHPDHQKGFHTEMMRLMPDYKKRRKALRG